VSAIGNRFWHWWLVGGVEHKFPQTGLWESLKKAVALYPNLSDDEIVGKDGTRHLNKKCVGVGTHCGAGECRQVMVCLLLKPRASLIRGEMILLTMGFWNLAR
jgi:hypothetical protein